MNKYVAFVYTFFAFGTRIIYILLILCHPRLEYFFLTFWFIGNCEPKSDLDFSLLCVYDGGY